jgi:SAM-dependent methyltransferase
MKNAESWHPTKFEIREGRLRASTNASHVSLGSRLNVDLLAYSLDSVLGECRGDLLDLGCGSVPLFARYTAQVASVTCMDWMHSAHGTSYIDITSDLNERLPVESMQFDTVLLTDVLEHVSAPGSLLAEINRVLRPSGKLIGSVPFMYWLHEEPFDHYRYTEHGLRKLIEGSGLYLQHLKEYGSGVDVVLDIASKLLVDSSLPLRYRLVSTIHRWRMRGVGASSRVGLDRRMPLGYIFVAGKP